jgi:hypothetical protein
MFDLPQHKILRTAKFFTLTLIKKGNLTFPVKKNSFVSRQSSLNFSESKALTYIGFKYQT